MRIFADDREADSGVIESLESFDEVEVRVERLPVGDYAVSNRLLFERKTLPDLALSIVDGRLFMQAARLTQTGLRTALILEGTARDLTNVNVSREAIQGALINLTVFMGIPILRSRGPDETAHLIVYAGRQLEALASGNIQRKGYRPKGKRRRQIHILQGLPGIGPKRAEQLLKQFGTVEAVFKATYEELVGLEGIGERTAAEIRWAVSESGVEYGGEDVEF